MQNVLLFLFILMTSYIFHNFPVSSHHHQRPLPLHTHTPVQENENLKPQNKLKLLLEGGGRNKREITCSQEQSTGRSMYSLFQDCNLNVNSLFMSS